MFTKGQRLIHEKFGDITDLVRDELLAMAQPRMELLQVRAEQVKIAKHIQDAKNLPFGRAVACLHPDIYDYWALREGTGFWTDKGNRENFLKDNPNCRVRSRSRNVVINGRGRGQFGSTRGRWAA